ncbi:MAG: glycoside hydrolase family 127 protein [Ancalomicrobiaceae bacterium]|nr:glycoside hydrolase family 127 protein [Ancalomicrobiaceae bacterium]
MIQSTSAPSTPRATRGKFRPPALGDVQVGGFFGPRIDTIASVTARILLDRCVEAGMLDQIDPDRPGPGLRIPFQIGNSKCTTQMFWDSDLAKSIETAAYALYRKRDAELEARVDAIIDAYGRLQAEDGYLNSWYQRVDTKPRWSNLRDCHELYDAGHLIEAAVAYYQATGKRKFIDIMMRYADHIASVFGTEPGKQRGYCGHPEIELALVRLARATGERRFLQLARYFVDERGRQPHYFDAEAAVRGDDPADYHFMTYQYNQSHVPVREQRQVVGHAVRAAYLYSAMADIATEFADETLEPALEALWAHLTEKNLYVTGGFGPSPDNEGLTFDYDLPNDTAYQETCASVALIFWANRMLGLGPNARYADILERALYNGALTGLSLDGTRFFYDNPLESRGQHHRWIWHKCPCCPPNISRLVASIGLYLFGVADDEIAVHLYCDSTAELKLAAGTVRIVETTRYPHDGHVSLTLEAVPAAPFALSLRIPGWAHSAELLLNGEEVDVAAVTHDGYARVLRQWTAGDRVDLTLPMPVETVHAAPEVGADQGRVALQRGPLVYCLEEDDNGGKLNSLGLAATGGFVCEEVPDLGGVVRVTAAGWRETPAEPRALYSAMAPNRARAILSAVPYYAWDNRTPGEMLVWIRQEGM